MRFWVLFLLCICSACGGGNAPQPTTNWLNAPWETVEKAAKDRPVRLMMWQGDPLINRYMSEWVVPELKNRYGIQLELVPGQGNVIVNLLMAEKEAGKTESSIDMCWINGETFFQLRQINGLQGPFTERLPNAHYIDFQNPFIGYDFQQPVAGFECPWGNVQLALLYDTLRTPEPPRTLEALESWVKAHPGRFTIPNEFTGLTLLKSWMIALSGDPNSLNGPFDPARYQACSARLFEFLQRIRPYFWRQGKAFPESLATLHQMFANGEVDFTMSNNDNEVDNKILQHIFPPSTRAYVPTSGTIQNSHYLGIAAGAANTAGAMAVINFLISPEAQLKKLNPAVWGDGTVLNLDVLPAEWKSRFEQIPERKNAPKRADIQPFALREPAPEYMLRLAEDFRRQCLEQ